MAKTMSPSGITQKQIGKMQDVLGAALRKAGLHSEPFQKVLEHQAKPLVTEVVAIVRKYVEVQSDIIIRRVRVDRTRTPMEVINATGRNKYVDEDIVATMPHGKGKVVDVWFIPTKRLVPASEVSAFLAQYGLVPDPRAQAAVNEQDPAFADQHPNGTQWGNNCCLTFIRWSDDERYVHCHRGGSDWNDCWFLVGVPAPRK